MQQTGHRCITRKVDRVRPLALLLLLFTFSVAHGRTLDADGAQIDIPDSWKSYKTLWIRPDETLYLDFRSVGSKGDPVGFSKSVRARLVQQAGDKLLTETQPRSFGGCQAAYWKSMSRDNHLTLNYLIGKNGNVVSLTLVFVKPPTDGEIESLESQILTNFRWP